MDQETQRAIQYIPVLLRRLIDSVNDLSLYQHCQNCCHLKYNKREQDKKINERKK